MSWNEQVARLRMNGLLLRGTRPKAVEGVLEHLTAMQAQEHAYARWSVAQRSSGSAQATSVDKAFDDGRILRTHILRPTWHYVAPRDLTWLMRLSGPRVDAGNSRRHRELGLEARMLNRSTDLIAEAVAGEPKTRRELGDFLERRRVSVDGQRIAYMVMHAELTGVICSGPIKGREHTYASFDERVLAGLDIEGDEALAELAWRYFSTRGPATVRDFSWWSGLRATDAQRGLELVRSRLDDRESEGRTYWLVDRDVRPPKTRIDLVQCYDEAIISYSESRDVLQTPSANFPVPRDLDGFRHVILRDGKLLGHWRTRQARGELRLETRVNGRLDKDGRTSLDEAVERYINFAGR